MDGVNDKSTPTDMPRNTWTDMIEAVRTRNERGVAMSNEQIASGVPISGTPGPAVRSADLGRPVEAPIIHIPPPMTPEEVEANMKAAADAGLIPPSAAGIDDELGGYASLEEAIRAGAPVTADAADVERGAAKFREPPTPALPAVGARAPIQRQTAREFIGRPVPPAPSLPRLPDFKNVQMIDLVNAKVWVDGLEFALEPAEQKMLRKFAVTKAKEKIEKALAAALKELAEATNGDDTGDSSAV